MTLEGERLLLARFADGTYANAFIYNYLIVTAHHVAEAGLIIETPTGSESGNYTFNHHQTRDLASSKEMARDMGFAESAMPNIGDPVWVFGHHGPDKTPFIIESEVHGFSKEGRIIIKRLEGKKFQLGMSGCPVVDAQNRLVGVLVEGVSNTNGEMCYLEPALAI